MMYWTWIVGIAVVIIALAVLWYFKKVPLVKRILYAMVCEAEKQFGSGTGEVKYATVIYMFYYRMPVFVRVVFTPAMISKWIEDAVTKLKSELSNGMDLSGVGEVAANCVVAVAELPPAAVSKKVTVK